MNLEEQKLAVCEKLPELVEFDNRSEWGLGKVPMWKQGVQPIEHGDINWPTEGLKICHEASKGFDIQLNILNDGSWKVILVGNQRMIVSIGKDLFTTWLDALCRVWWPERFV